jgi:NAD-dependent deacetylase
VHPAAGLPRMAWEVGAPLLIVNREPTPLDQIATLALREEIGPLLRGVMDLLDPAWEAAQPLP